MWRPWTHAPAIKPTIGATISPRESRTVMSKSVIVKLFIGSLIGLVGAAVLFVVAISLAGSTEAFIMEGPDVVGVRPDGFAWVTLSFAGLGVLLMVLASIGLFVAWIGAVVATAALPDKVWFIVLLVGGLLSVGFAVTLAYVIAGPDTPPSSTPLDRPIPIAEAAPQLAPDATQKPGDLIHS